MLARRVSHAAGMVASPHAPPAPREPPTPASDHLRNMFWRLSLYSENNSQAENIDFDAPSTAVRGVEVLLAPYWLHGTFRHAPGARGDFSSSAPCRGAFFTQFFVEIQQKYNSVEKYNSAEKYFSKTGMKWVQLKWVRRWVVWHFMKDRGGNG